MQATNSNLQQIIADIQLAPSLVKYGNPVLISTGQKKQIKAATTNNTGDILNSILPPREFNISKQQLQIQCVSAAPSTKQDVLELQDKLDKQLQQRQARETGLCPIREELFSQCFDELIRQITINCAERGLLLVRVRDEVRMVIQTYQQLYVSSIAFGMRKYLQEEEKKEELRTRISQLGSDCSDLTKQVQNLESKIQEIKQTDEEKRQLAQASHLEQVTQLRAATKERVLGKQDSLDLLLSGKVPIPEKK